MTAVDWNTPGPLNNYATEILQFLRSRDENIAKMDFTGDSNLPTGFIRSDASDSDKLKRWNGSSYVALGFHTTIDAHIANSSIHQPAVPGAIIMYGGAAAPSGYLLCDGTAVSRTTYAALFAVVGTTFGVGDGSTTFNLPDLRGRFPLGKAAAGTGSTLGGTGGALDHTHTGPSHTHTVAAHNHDMGSHTHNTQDHSHTNPTHTHTIPAHYHAATGNGADINIGSSGSHSHNLQARNNAIAGTNDPYVKADNSGPGTGDTTNTINNSTSNHVHGNAAFAGRVGNVSSGNNGDGTLTSGAGGGANTGSVVGSPPATLGPSTNNTSSTALTTDAGGTGATGGSNPAFQVINYIIKT